MERNWTPSQRAAIESKGKNLLLSAAAGSGKTAVLTERIIRSLTRADHPLDISRILVVTFTKAAAKELQNRIFTAFHEAIAAQPHNEHLVSQLTRLGSAKICTIDAFYLDLVKKYAAELGIASNFRIADFSEVKILERDILDECISQFYDEDTDGFSRFAECFVSMRQSSRLGEVLWDFYTRLATYPEGIDYLLLCADQLETDSNVDFFASSFAQECKTQLRAFFDYYRCVFDEALSYTLGDDNPYEGYQASFAYDLNYTQAILDQLNHEDYNTVSAAVCNYKPLRAKSLRGIEESEQFCFYKGIRTNFSAHIKKITAKYFSMPQASVKRAMQDTALILRKMHQLLSLYEERCEEQKTSIGIYSLSDIRRKALKLLVDSDGNRTEMARQISEAFDEIYIDEYQDVDQTQDIIFQAISNGHNRFMVGDIKQSIYSFRGADPSVFSRYRREFPLHGDSDADTTQSEQILMSDNFRCDRPVIHTANAICSLLFSACAQKIGYTPQDDLHYGKNNGNPQNIEQQTEIAFISAKSEDGNEIVEDLGEESLSAWEAKMVATRIHQMIHNETRPDGTPYRYGDFAVLYRSKTISEHLRRALNELGIPFAGGKEEAFFDNPEILLMISVLNVIDNPMRDIYLAATLRSPLFQFSLDDLITIRRSAPKSYSLYDAVREYATQTNELSQKASAFCDLLDTWRNHATSISTERLIRYLLDQDCMIRCALNRSQKILRLYEYARQMETDSYRGLYSFIRHINNMMAHGENLSAEESDIQTDAVNLMTIHHAKGLEFPVCILCGTSSRFNMDDSRDSLQLFHGLGIAMKLSNGSGFAKINTPMRSVILTQGLAAQAEEEMRVLYVALTRAKERLLITASLQDSPAQRIAHARFQTRLRHPYPILHASCSLDWILSGLIQNATENATDAATGYSLSVLRPSLIADTIANALLHTEAPILEPLEEIKTYDDYATRPELSFQYPYEAISKLPAKISISRLSPDILDTVNDAVPLICDSHKGNPTYFSETESQRATAAERGTATHLFLQFCNFERMKKFGVTIELDTLIQQGFLPENTKDLIFKDELEQFGKSDVAEQILESKQVIREQRFNILLDSRCFTTLPKLQQEFHDEMLAVQGVMDLLLIDHNGNITLIDYKTDRLSHAERTDEKLLQKTMQERHGLQLSYYDLAIRQLFGRPCTNILVYSTHASRSVTIHSCFPSA